jgi:putative hydrolase of the HAD superfamily
MPCPSDRSVDAVVFDLGGVILANGSPRDFARHFPDLDPDLVLPLLMGPFHQDSDHPWHRVERGEISLDECRELNREALALHGVELPRVERDADGTVRGGPGFTLHEGMVALVHELRSAGVRLGVLTNNLAEFRGLWWPMLPWPELFEVIVDSHEVGMRKPDPRIYRLTLERLGMADAPGRVAFVDDLRPNVDAAVGVGMHGVWVHDHTAVEAMASIRALSGL